MQMNEQQDEQNIKVTIHIPKNVSDVIRQTKINQIYDILNSKIKKDTMLPLKRKVEYGIIYLSEKSAFQYIVELWEADKMNKITAIYVRRSVSDKDKGNNSLSIDAQNVLRLYFGAANSERKNRLGACSVRQCFGNSAGFST